MNLRSFLLPFAALSSAFVASAVQPQHLADAIQLVDEIQATQSLGIFEDAQGTAVNTYGGSWNSVNNPSFIRFYDEANGILPANRTTCAPFVTHLLKHTYHWSWSSYLFFDPISHQNKKTASPNPLQYKALIEQQVGFVAQIFDARTAQPGDVISIHYQGTTSGHTVLLVDLDLAHPMPYPDSGANLNPALAGTTYYRLRILDSTSSPHSHDTREFSVVDPQTDEVTAYETDGVGTGDMGIFLDAQGHVIGHTWSLPNSHFDTELSGWINGINSRLHLQAERTLVIGRLP